ncbi:hypothetical protein EON66_06260 [archaeon]|nr:MAG: hypothetical protein EON66_06260 [archaeon]
MLLQWGPLTLDHMRKKLVHNDAVAYIFMFLSFSLTCLNVFWFSQMVRIMLSPGKKRPAKKDTTKKGDASGTLSPSVDELRLKSA